jgi:hypothetical protein
MPLQASGPISISQIRTELGNVSYSLRTLSAAAGKATPDAMSEFYGYSSVILADYLVVGGGGGGVARYYGGNGGNAGQFQQGSNFVITKGLTYNISVGGGGAADGVGTNSIFSTFTSVAGGSALQSVTGKYGKGGNGAGGGGLYSHGGVGLNSVIGNLALAGGGGAMDGYAQGFGGGNGGWSYSGPLQSTPASANSGAGGGGGSYNFFVEQYYPASNGGSGIVSLRTLNTVPTATYAGATLTQPTGYKIYTFYGSGTITFN